MKPVLEALRSWFVKAGAAPQQFPRKVEPEAHRIPLSELWNDESIHLRTWSGQRVHILNPRLDEIRIDDIAHGLANTCRFGGQTPFFYSVADHSVRVADLVPHKLQLWGLLHDASEAYLHDITRPLKRSLPGYKEIEERMMAVICRRFGLPEEMPLKVKKADNQMIAAEFRDLFGDTPEQYLKWSDGYFAAPARVWPHSPEVAKHIFLLRFQELIGRTVA